mgnify:CR=1 FL=1
MDAWLACVGCHDFAAFSDCSRDGKPLMTPPVERRRLIGVWCGLRHRNRIIMDNSGQKSCWGIAAKAVAGFAGIILLAWLVGGTETAAVLATAG